MLTITLTNDFDRAAALQGLIEAANVRSVEAEGLVDTGATGLVIPPELAVVLGVSIIKHGTIRLADGRILAVDRVGPIRIEILGRDMVTDAIVLPGAPRVLIGQIPLEALDFVVDPRSGELRQNPEHPDGPEMEVFVVAA
jgi:clan AA aspartic protease